MPTNAFIKYKQKVQKTFDFAAVVTTGIPSLKHQISLFRKGEIYSLPRPDFFQATVNYMIDDMVLQKLLDKGLEQNAIQQLHPLKNKSLNYNEYKRSIIGIIGETKYKDFQEVFRHQSQEYVNNLLDSAENYRSSLAEYLYLSSFSFFEYYIKDLCTEVLQKNDFSLDTYAEHRNNLSRLNASEKAPSYRKKLNGSYDKNRIDRYKKYSKLLKQEGYVKPKTILEVSLQKLLLEKLDSLKAKEIPTFLE